MGMTLTARQIWWCFFCVMTLTSNPTGQKPEGALGAYPVPTAVGMAGETSRSCADCFVLTDTVISAATHEVDEGYFNIVGAGQPGMTIVVQPGDLAHAWLAKNNNRRISIVLVPEQ
jgi:hypothetical protein